ncbi:MAG: hypothetical protein LBT47_01005 [Deltaproteobacteria bacterium]|jgi:hypothetical protein|nr:hypothetical protein [Deltaproteobacteria bacterium]
MKYTQPPGFPENTAYVDFSPANGIEGSVVPAAAIEAPQREIIKVITEAGIVPNAGDLTQLYQALAILWKTFSTANTVSHLSGPGVRSQDYAENALYTVPGYVVGASQLHVFWNGLHCAKGRQYTEVGTAGAVSTQIKLLHDLSISDAYDVYVRG